jgi:hypothetical protein
LAVQGRVMKIANTKRIGMRREFFFISLSSL